MIQTEWLWPWLFFATSVFHFMSCAHLKTGTIKESSCLAGSRYREFILNPESMAPLSHACSWTCDQCFDSGRRWFAFWTTISAQHRISGYLALDVYGCRYERSSVPDPNYMTHIHSCIFIRMLLQRSIAWMMPETATLFILKIDIVHSLWSQKVRVICNEIMYKMLIEPNNEFSCWTNKIASNVAAAAVAANAVSYQCPDDKIKLSLFFRCSAICL